FVCVHNYGWFLAGVWAVGIALAWIGGGILTGSLAMAITAALLREVLKYQISTRIGTGLREWTMGWAVVVIFGGSLVGSIPMGIARYQLLKSSTKFQSFVILSITSFFGIGLGMLLYQIFSQLE
ncbi:MAG: hypothetical protein ACOC3E_02620, partial [Cyanobacteriota bacterium]